LKSAHKSAIQSLCFQYEGIIMARSNVIQSGVNAVEAGATQAAASKGAIALGDASMANQLEQDKSATQNSAAKMLSQAARTAQEALSTTTKGAMDMMKSAAG
jgi:hypothetical protein